MFGLSGGEMIVILLAFLILFGSKKIPEFAQALGKGMKEFKKATGELEESIKKEAEIKTTTESQKTPETENKTDNQTQA